MKKRSKMSRKYSKKLFSKTAQKYHPRNSKLSSRAMRGGIRL